MQPAVAIYDDEYIWFGMSMIIDWLSNMCVNWLFYYQAEEAQITDSLVTYEVW